MEQLIQQLAIGAFMIVVTVFVHSIALDIIIHRADQWAVKYRRIFRRIWKSVMISKVVLAIFITHIVIIWLWALLYLFLQCAPLSNLHDALYFASVVYSTLGFGDIILEDACRMLSGIQGANGFILFGWTSAFIFEIVSQIYRKEAGSL